MSSDGMTPAALAVYLEFIAGKKVNSVADCGRLRKAASALRALASQEKQEPVAWQCAGCGRFCSDPKADFDDLKSRGFLSCCPERKMKPLFTAPPIPQPAPDWEEAIDAAVSLVRQWRDDAAEFTDPRAQIQKNVCQNLSTAIKALRSKPTDTVATVADIKLRDALEGLLACCDKEKDALNEARWKDVEPLEECSLPEFEFENCEFRRASRPSDRTADVTVEEIALVLLDGWKAGKAPIQIAADVRRAFTVGRR